MVRPVSASIKDFLRNLSWSGTAIVLSLGADFGFYILTGRLLGPELFGMFGVFMAMYYLSIGPLSHAIEIATKKITAEESGNPSNLIAPTLKAGLIFWILFLGLTPIIGKLFSLSITSLIAFSFVYPFAYVLAVLVGIVQGKGNFRGYAYYEILSSIAKFSALGLIVLGFGIIGAVLAPVMEILAGFLVTVTVLRPNISSIKFSNYSLLQKSCIFILAVYAAFSVDILMIKIFMTAETVGLYNAVATIGKAVFFGSVAINRAVFPKLVKNPAKNFSLLHLALFLILCGGGAAVAIFSTFGTEFITWTFGPDYAVAAKIAPLYMIFITLVSAVSLLGNYYVSSNMSHLKIVLLLPILEIIGIFLFHESVLQILYLIIGIAASTFLLLYIPIILNRYYF